MLEVLANSAVGSGVVRSKIPTLVGAHYDNPAMSLHNIVKDLDLALAAGAEVGVELPATNARARALRAGPRRRSGVEGLLRGGPGDGAAGRVGADPRASTGVSIRS